MAEQKLLQDLADAEMVLVGLGEEFDCTRAFRDNEAYRAGKEAFTASDDKAWLLPAWMRTFREQSGAGEECRRALRALAGMLEGKNYFVISVSLNGDIVKVPWREGRLVCPVYHPNRDESLCREDWGRYTKWLAGTLNHRLLILELGVGLTYPSLIRFPFEKTAYFNQKSKFYRVHENLNQLTPEIAERAVSIPENAIDCLKNIC